MRKGQTKTPQKENLYKAQGRDLFQTPDYATDIIVPFLKKAGVTHVWECAAGQGRMTHRLSSHGFTFVATDISYENPFNFLTDGMTFLHGPGNWAIVTNPPFSLQRKFFERCFEYGFPFALLVPAVYSGWIIGACELGAEKVVPKRRIDYITPNVLNRIHEGETWETLGITSCKMKEYKEKHPRGWEFFLAETSDRLLFKSIDDVPPALLRKYSSSDFHSMWLTMGLGIGRQETFVELTNGDKNNI